MSENKMVRRSFAIAFTIICIFGSVMKSSYASTSPTTSPTRTYQFRFDDTSTHVLGWNVTAPLYASRGSPVTLNLGFHVYPTGGINLSPLRLEVTTTLDNSATQQVFFGILLQGSYSVGFDRTFTETITIPSNAMIGSSLNVSAYTDINKWFLYPTEIRDMNYDDLQSAYDNAQSQIDSLNQQLSSLNQQIANLTSSNNTLSQQVASLNSQVADLNSQVSNLKNQSMILTTIIPLVTSIVAVIAVAVAVYMFYSKRKLTRNLPQRKYAVGSSSTEQRKS